MAERIKLTKSRVEKIPYASTGRFDVFDSDLKGFGVRVSSSKKMYFVLRRVKGKLSRVTIGATNTLTVEQARRKAEGIIADLNAGIDVNGVKRKQKLRSRSLEEIRQNYFGTRDLKRNTAQTYQKLLSNNLADWLKLPLSEITPDMVSERHKKIAEKSGKATANNTMRTFRAIYNHGLALCEDLPRNPVERLTLARQWYRVERRKTSISQSDLPVWFSAVKAYPNQLIGDYLLLLLFTGLRREETSKIRWEDVDMNQRIFTLRDTKNRKDHMLPMSDFVYEIFQRRLNERMNDYVFFGTGQAGHFHDPRKAIEAIMDETGVKFCNHDLRRTFTTIAEGLVSYSTLKRLLNHSREGDVTQGYMSHGIDDLRGPVQKVTDVILRLCDKPKRGKVIKLGTRG